MRVYDGAMATWEDGPEYAPLERPADFAAASVAPLPVAPAFEQPAAHAPKGRPVFDQPPVPVAPLSSLVPPVADVRNPHAAFDVVSTAMTAGPTHPETAWGAVHGGTGHWGPPAGPPVGVPAGPRTVASGPEHPFVLSGPAPTSSHGGFPAPGTPDWFAPAPVRQPPAPQRPIGVQAVLSAATPGLLICLLIGGLIPVISPILLVVCLALAGRVQAGTRAVRTTLLAAIGLVAVVALLAPLAGVANFSDWWSAIGGWSLALCWVSLVLTLFFVHRGLTSGPPPQSRSSWG